MTVNVSPYVYTPDWIRAHWTAPTLACAYVQSLLPALECWEKQPLDFRSVLSAFPMVDNEHSANHISFDKVRAIL